MLVNYRKHDCYKCSNEKCNDEFSQFIPSFNAAFSDFVECENYTDKYRTVKKGGSK